MCLDEWTWHITTMNFFPFLVKPLNTSFFFNQHFITWGVRVDCGSYFVTMYMINKAIWRIEKERREKEE